MPRLTGPIHDFGLREKRRYMVVTVPYKQARGLFKAELFKAGSGEQRAITPSHARKLSREISADNYTPSAFHAGLRPRHVKLLTVSGDGCGLLDLADTDWLPLTDGNHRNTGIGYIFDEAKHVIASTKSSDAEKEAAKQLLEKVEQLPITVFVHLDGSTQKDFIRLQCGRAVDASHLLSLQISQSMVSGSNAMAVSTAYETAKVLATSSDSVFYKQIRFDSQGMAPLPVSSLCAKGGSDIAASLVGLARVAANAAKPLKPTDLAAHVTAVTKGIDEKAPDLSVIGKVLTPPPDGSKGSSTMLIGVANVALAYKILCPGDPKWLDKVIAAAAATLDMDTHGNFSSAIKRNLLGQFTYELFSDVDVEKRDGIPVDLIKWLSASSLGLAKASK